MLRHYVYSYNLKNDLTYKPYKSYNIYIIRMDVFESNLNNIIKTKLQEVNTKLFEREQIKKELHSSKSDTTSDTEPTK